MAMLQKLSAGRESSITSNASGSKSQGILNMNCERKTDLSGIALKARKPYTISKQRQKWTEEEHQKFIEALQLYGRAWRQIEEYIGTKTAVQIRSHAQKFFSKVMKEGASSAEASAEPIEIPPPRPKRKPLHPYPRKLMETPNKIKQCPSLIENGTSASLKTSEREAHSPISVLSPEGSQISTSHAKEQGSGCVSRTSSGSNISHVVEKSSLIKDSSTLRKENEKEGNLSLTLNITGPSLDDSTLTSAGKVLKDIEFTKDEDNYSETRINFAGGGGAPLKIIKLFGHTVAVANQSEYSDGMNSVAMHLASKESQTDAPITEMALNLVNQLVPGGILMGERPREKEGSKVFSRTGLSAQTNLDSVDSKIGYSQRTKVNPNDLRKGFAPYKRCLIDREAAASLKSTADDRESQRIRVYL